MEQFMLRMRKQVSFKLRQLAALCAILVPMVFFTGFITSVTTYVIVDGEIITTLEGYSGNLEEAFERCGIRLTSSDRVQQKKHAGRVTEILITRSQWVTVSVDGCTTVALAYNDTVFEVLQRLEVELGKDDIVSVDLDSLIRDHITIQVVRRAITEEVVRTEIPFSVSRVGNPALEAGKEHVLTPGQAGEKHTIHTLVSIDGGAPQLVSSREEIVREPVAQVEEYGTKVLVQSISALSVSKEVISEVEAFAAGGGVLTTSHGTREYSSMLTCTATAYTTEGKKWKITATGSTARVGAIAVDPKVIPYGTKMYIVTSDGSIVYGVATAEDCGGAIKGKKIDLFFDTYRECIEFGRRSCSVYILKD